MPTMSIVKNGEKYLTQTEAMQFLGVSRQTLWRLVQTKRLHQYKQGITRSVYYKQADLERLVDLELMNDEEE